jgi:outer membrane protein, heavy metal efflux system
MPDSTRLRPIVLLATVVAMTTSLGGCALYHPASLDEAPGKSLASLTVPAGTLVPGRDREYPFDASDGLDATEVAMVAVVYSPSLRIGRARAAVDRAQAFAAGLLPDPVFGLSRDQPSAGQVGASTAYTRGLTWDFGQLVTYGARRSAARHTDEQVRLDLLWAEWQVVARSRLLFARVRSGRELVARLEAEDAVLKPLQPRLAAALRQGNVTFDVATTGLSAAADVARQLSEARTTLSTAEHDLRELLGLAADEPLRLVGDADVPAVADPDVASALAASPPRRPDLRALHEGYAAQDARLRAAILGQFPSVNFGVTRSRDNSDISSSGFTLSVSLPLFDRNQGAVRVEQASREQLHAEYAERLLSARSDVARLLAAQQILNERAATLMPYARDLKATAARAESAYGRGLMEWTTYLALRQSALAADVEAINVRLTLAETRIGLATLATGRWPE